MSDFFARDDKKLIFLRANVVIGAIISFIDLYRHFTSHESIINYLRLRVIEIYGGVLSSMLLLSVPIRAIRNNNFYKINRKENIDNELEKKQMDCHDSSFSTIT